MSNIPFDPPRQARIISSKYPQYSATLATMGLRGPAFRAVGETSDGSIFVHPEDLSRPVERPVIIRRDIVELVEPEE